MEDPIRFELWGTIVAERRESALRHLRDQAIFPTELELRKAVVRCVRDGEALRISRDLGYEAVQKLAAAVAETFNCLTYCQEGYAPFQASGFCQKHNHHYGGCLGCHVCSGFCDE